MSERKEANRRPAGKKLIDEQASTPGHHSGIPHKPVQTVATVVPENKKVRKAALAARRAANGDTK